MFAAPRSAARRCRSGGCRSAPPRTRPASKRRPVAGCFLALLACLTFQAVALGASAAEPTGFTGLLAVRGDEILFEENADRLFVPASVQKIVTAAAALHHLGPEHRSVTNLRIAGSLVEGEPEPGSIGPTFEVRGDLVVEAVGDPSWSDELREGDARRPLRELGRRLRASGLVRVTGDLVIDTSRFPGRSVPLEWGRGDMALSYGAAPSALAVDENVVRVRMAPGGSVGEPARVSGPDDLDLVNSTVTVSAQRHRKGTVDFLPVWGESRVVVTGEYPISEGAFTVRLAAPDPTRRAARALREELDAAGVEIAGDTRITSIGPPVSGDSIDAIVSVPLAEILAVVLTDSNNWYAETILRQLAAAVTGEGRLDGGLEVVADFLEEVVGLDPGSFELDDGSGLSSGNLITPRAAVELLRFCLRQPWSDVLLGSLSTGANGETEAKGTLASWGGMPPIAAKTGTLRYTQTLAGVLLPTEEGAEPVVFAAFLNHRTDERRALKREIVQRLWEWSRTPAQRAATTRSGD